MIVLFTDFGLEGPYVGQIKAVLHREAPGAPVIDLFHDAPAHEPELAAYLLAAYVGEFPEGAVFLCVVDPGVGSEERRPAVVRAEGRWYVGPDNGLFAIVARRARAPSWWDITARPGSDRPGSDWPDDLPRIIYFDRFGNAMTGLRAAALTRGQTLEVNGRPLARARTFSDAPPGQPFWYENSSGLAAIAVNRGRADEALGLHLGDPVIVRDG